MKVCINSITENGKKFNINMMSMSNFFAKFKIFLRFYLDKLHKALNYHKSIHRLSITYEIY